jgi:GH35 family endo-1,4-beta-xylanase
MQLILILILVLATRHSGETRAEDLPTPTGPRFKKLVPIDGSAGMLVGATISVGQLGTQAEVSLKRDFEFCTPANEFKQAAVHPEPNVWRWKKADQMFDFCTKHNYLMRLHAPMSPQCSAWAEEDNRQPNELLTNLEEYVTAIAQRYNGKPNVRWWDVVNETVTDKGEWFGPKPGTGDWQNPWTQIGLDETHPLKPPLYIKRAFELADQHAPQIKLLYNQHAGMEKPMWEKVKATVLYLREKNVRVDGIGWQAHVDAGWEQDPENLRYLNELITWAHSLKLEFHVTENTVWMRSKRGDQPKNKKLKNQSASQGDIESAQAATFAAIVRTLIQHRSEGVVTWNAWQLRDSDIQRPELKGTMFDEQGRPKKAYFAVQEELMKLGK